MLTFSPSPPLCPLRPYEWERFQIWVECEGGGKKQREDGENQKRKKKSIIINSCFCCRTELQDGVVGWIGSVLSARCGILFFLLSGPARELAGLSVIISYHIVSYQYCGSGHFGGRRSRDKIAVH